jgi:hypothetical protein
MDAEASVLGAGPLLGGGALDLEHVAQRLSSIQAANMTVDIPTRFFSPARLGIADAKTPKNTPALGQQKEDRIMEEAFVLRLASYWNLGLLWPC